MKFTDLFLNSQPIIGTVHFPALPELPFYDPKSGIDYVIDSAKKDLQALQK